MIHEPTPNAPTASAQPVVTVVVPCYEAGSRLEGTIASLVAQTFTAIEILVIDDGSVTDPVHSGSPLFADARIVVERRPASRGSAAVTNHAVARARGEWVTVVDPEDEVAPTYVERLLEAARQADADLAVAPIMAVRDGREIGTLRFDAAGAVIPARQAFRHAVRGELVLSDHLLLRRPQPDADVGFTFSDFTWVLKHLARSRRVALVHEPLYRYRIHGGPSRGSLRPSVLDLERMPELAAGLWS